MARPLKFQSVEELELKIQGFFDLIKKGEEEPSVIGLACHLDVHKQTLLNYQDKPEFEPTIDRAKSLIEKMFTARALKGEIPPAIFIFVSKNHYEYKDTQDFNHGGQPGNPVILDDAARKSRITELLNKRGAAGAIGASRGGEAQSDKE